MQLQFLGAAGTVTGSRYLVSEDGARLLVDCGMFQGVKRLRERNRADFPVAPDSLQAVVLTHAHLDHSGWLPALVKQGFRGPVYCTAGTAALLEILLPDAAHLQEEDAAYANRKGFSRHQPAEPLYTREDAEAALRHLKPVDWDQRIGIAHERWQLQFRHGGHIIGAASAYLHGAAGCLGFSGDVGRPQDPVLKPPATRAACDWLVTESTYGDRQHPDTDVMAVLADTISDTARRGGVTVLPAFAVGRAQMLLHLLLELRQQGRIPALPIFLDSPMASKATQIMLRFPEEHRLSREQCMAMANHVEFIDSVEESIALGLRRDPHIIVSASGMATGGRVLHHLKRLLPDPRHQVIFVGFQSAGTRGDSLVHGSRFVKIHGDYIPVRAPVLNIDALSAHADQDELLDWLGSESRAPQQVFVTHGEPAAADCLRRLIKDRLHWPALVPEALESFRLEKS